MDDNVIPFARPSWRDLARNASFGECSADANNLAASLGTPDQWRESAILHLKAASSCPAPDGVLVSQAALHLVLGYVEHLEGRLGLIPDPAGAA